MNGTEVFAMKIKKENPMFSLKKDINWLRIKATDYKKKKKGSMLW